LFGALLASFVVQKEKLNQPSEAKTGDALFPELHLAGVDGSGETGIEDEYTIDLSGQS
jgi:hypothetical protein